MHAVYKISIVGSREKYGIMRAHGEVNAHMELCEEGEPDFFREVKKT